MEIADVKRRVVDTIERAKRRAGERRTRADEAAKAFDLLLVNTIVPVFRQVANVLKSEKYPFDIFTPGASVRLVAEKAPEDFIEIALDSTGDEPAVILHTKRARGRRVIESEQAVGDPATLTDDEILRLVLAALEPFVER